MAETTATNNPPAPERTIAWQCDNCGRPWLTPESFMTCLVCGAEYVAPPVPVAREGGPQHG